ncbi:MAG TPA: STAS domain-containing protein [Candidatus Krumholzibacteria bacterium]|nr:STAS domain-containing protein [Candidatus Krumholzibacteria bacterium]
MITVDRSTIGDVHVLTPRKNLVGGDETRVLSAAVQELTGNSSVKVVLDLGRINWVSSLGIEELRRIHRICANHQGWMRLACVGERIENIILTMRLDWVFDTFDTVEEAALAPARGMEDAPHAWRFGSAV